MAGVAPIAGVCSTECTQTTKTRLSESKATRGGVGYHHQNSG